MIETYEKQREHLAREQRTKVQNITNELHNRISNTINHYTHKQKLLAEIAEDYYKRGYFLFRNEHYVGEFKTARSFVVQLAKDMRRPWVEVTRDIREWTYGMHMGVSRIRVPSAKKYCLLTGQLDMLLSNQPKDMPSNNEEMIQKTEFYDHVVFTLYGVRGSPHFMIKEWMTQAETNPDWIALLKPHG